jgi:hypothetical protein
MKEKLHISNFIAIEYGRIQCFINNPNISMKVSNKLIFKHKEYSLYFCTHETFSNHWHPPNFIVIFLHYTTISDY